MAENKSKENDVGVSLCSQTDSAVSKVDVLFGIDFLQCFYKIRDFSPLISAVGT